MGIHTEHLGRGPRTASTFHYGNVLVTLMHEVMTPAEKTLAGTGNGPAVKNMRHLFQETMQVDFCSAVERLTGGTASQDGCDPDRTMARSGSSDHLPQDAPCSGERMFPFTSVGGR